jgi:hypothetical protein
MKPLLPHYQRTGSQHTGYWYVAKATMPIETSGVIGVMVMRDVKVTIWKERASKTEPHPRLWSYRIDQMLEDNAEVNLIEEGFACSTMTEVKQRVKTILDTGIRKQKEW